MNDQAKANETLDLTEVVNKILRHFPDGKCLHISETRGVEFRHDDERYRVGADRTVTSMSGLPKPGEGYGVTTNSKLMRKVLFDL